MVRRFARSEPACGSEKPWHQCSDASRIAGQPARLLVVGAPRDDRRPDLHDAVRVEDAGRAVLRHHLRVDDLLRGGRGAPAPLLGPEDRGPAPFVELVLPRLALVHDAHDATRRVGVLVVGPQLDERRHLLVEERLELFFERDVFGRPGEVHTEPDISVRSKYRASRGLHLLARAARAARLGARVPRGRGADDVRAAHGRARRRRHHARGLGARSSTSAGPACSSRSRRAVSGSASSTRSSCRRRWAARSSPGPYFSSAILATLAARALGLDDQLDALAAGTQRGTVALDEAGYGDPIERVHVRANGRGTRYKLDGVKPMVPDGCTGRLGARARPHARRPADVPRRATRDAEPVASLDVTRKFARIEFDETRAHARRSARRSRRHLAPHRRRRGRARSAPS